VVNGYASDGTVATAAYGTAGEMTSLSHDGYNESRTYNSLLQLSRQTVPGVFDMEYVFPGGANNGQISSTIDHISGQQVNYTYDALKRLATAATVSTAWGQAYSYDGFGNLTAKTVTQGTGSNLAQAYDPSTNHAIANSGLTYDADGNTYFAGQSTGYDGENRLAQQGAESYWYDPSGKRVLETNSSSGEWTLFFYDIFGKRITNVPSADTPVNVAYFGSKPLEEWRRNGYSVAYVSDRLGSVRVNSNNETFSYLPYGEEQTSTADNRVKFATYFRDSPSQDYADQRYYNPAFGRFNSVDPSTAGNPADPASWNKYAYAGGDPINFNDPWGMEKCDINGDPIDCPAPPPGFGGSGDSFGGREGPVNPIYDKDPQSNFIECNGAGNKNKEQSLSFLVDNYQAAVAVSAGTGVAADWILAWSAEETNSKGANGAWLGWGSAPQVSTNGNYFNEKAGAWNTATLCPPGANAKWACFGDGGATPLSFAESATAALTSFNNRYLNALLGAAPNGEATAFQALANAGFEPYNPNYGTTIQKITGSLDKMLDCLKNNGYIAP